MEVELETIKILNQDHRRSPMNGEDDNDEDFLFLSITTSSTSGYIKNKVLVASRFV
jgi:hypothetical protein